MKKWLLILVMLGWCHSFFASGPTLDLILSDLKQSEENLSHYAFISTLTQYEQGKNVKTAKFLIVVSGEDSLAYFLSPISDKGKIVLQKGSNYFLYFPKPKQYIRVSPELNVFSNVSYGDLIKPPLTKYYELTKLLNLDSKKSNLEFSLRDGVNNFPYFKKVVLFDVQNKQILQIDSYSRSGILLGRAEYQSFLQSNNVNFPKKTKLWDIRSKSDFSIQENTDFKTIVFPESLFAPTSLRTAEQDLKRVFSELQ